MPSRPSDGLDSSISTNPTETSRYMVNHTKKELNTGFEEVWRRIRLDINKNYI